MTLPSRVAYCVNREQSTCEPSRHATRHTPHATRHHHLLFIAYGNTLRRDDGAGLALAEKLCPLLAEWGLHVDLIAVQQLTPELALAIADPTLKAVCFFDTAAEHHPVEIQMQRVDAPPTTPVLGHHLIPSALLLYAKRLYGVCPPAWLVTIPGYDFELGEGFSAKTAYHLANVAALAQQVAQVTSPERPK
jgi:hydrogenase maturation protease